MTKTHVITNIPEELVNTIEAYQYEVNSRMDVISYMLSNNMTLGTESFNQYQAELINHKKMLDAAKQELETNIVRPYLDANNIPNASWNLDFASGELTISWTVAGIQQCSCENGQCKHEEA